MKKEKIPKYITQLIAVTLTATAIINPLLAIITAIVVPTTFTVSNKILFKNKKAELFAVNKQNYIGQKLGKNFFKIGLIKNKSEYFKTEMLNLLLDLKKENNYTTISQALVYKELQRLEKLNLIENLTKLERPYKNKIEQHFQNYLINFGLGNFNNLLKNNKKYNISFKRTNKKVDEEILKELLQENNVIIKNKKGIKKIKLKNKKQLNNQTIIENKVQEVKKPIENNNQINDINQNNNTNLTNQHETTSSNDVTREQLQELRDLLTEQKKENINNEKIM